MGVRRVPSLIPLIAAAASLVALSRTVSGADIAHVTHVSPVSYVAAHLVCVYVYIVWGEAWGAERWEMVRKYPHPPQNTHYLSPADMNNNLFKLLVLVVYRQEKERDAAQLRQMGESRVE